MGGAPSRISPAERIDHLNILDRENAQVGTLITDKNNEIAVLSTELDKKRTEYNNINQILADLTNEKNAKSVDKRNLEKYKSQLEEYKKKLEYSIRLSEQELAGLSQFINLQQRNKLYYDTEYNTLFNKVVNRNQLKHKGYSDRNTILERTTNHMEQTYSNIHADSKYQNLHNEYFMTLNAIFWWVYYLLFIVICYQIVYIQTDLTLITKITWLTVLLLFPLLYYVYDLVVIKI